MSMGIIPQICHASLFMGADLNVIILETAWVCLFCVLFVYFGVFCIYEVRCGDSEFNSWIK